MAQRNTRSTSGFPPCRGPISSYTESPTRNGPEWRPQRGERTNREKKIRSDLGQSREYPRPILQWVQDNPATTETLRAAARVPHVEGIELVGTWDITPETVSEMEAALGDCRLRCVSIIPDLFANRLYWKGSYSAADPGCGRILEMGRRGGIAAGAPSGELRCLI